MFFHALAVFHLVPFHSVDGEIPNRDRPTLHASDICSQWKPSWVQLLVCGELTWCLGSYDVFHHNEPWRFVAWHGLDHCILCIFSSFLLSFHDGPIHCLLLPMHPALMAPFYFAGIGIMLHRFNHGVFRVHGSPLHQPIPIGVLSWIVLPGSSLASFRLLSHHSSWASARLCSFLFCTFRAMISYWIVPQLVMVFALYEHHAPPFFCASIYSAPIRAVLHSRVMSSAGYGFNSSDTVSKHSTASISLRVSVSVLSIVPPSCRSSKAHSFMRSS